MRKSHTHVLRAVAFLATCFLPYSGLAQHFSWFDIAIPERKEVSESLELAKRLSTRTTPTAKEFLLLYYAEKRIGRSVWGPSPSYKDTSYQHFKLFAHYLDTALASQATAYVDANRDRFCVLEDGWKGEENFWEPTDALLVRMKRLYPNAMETRELEFDLEFKQLVRQFDIDPDAQGESCEQHHKEELERHAEDIKESYTEAEIAQWPAECAKVREEFAQRRRQLLSKYQNASFTKVLSDIDITTIIVHHPLPD